MREVNIGRASDFADPGRKIIGFERFEIAVFKLGGEFFAYLNHCPHMGGPACQGKMIAKVEEIIADDRTSNAKWADLGIASDTFRAITPEAFEVVELGPDIELTYNCVRNR